jgi:hypothetical protein
MEALEQITKIFKIKKGAGRRTFTGVHLFGVRKIQPNQLPAKI